MSLRVSVLDGLSPKYKINCFGSVFLEEASDKEVGELLKFIVTSFLTDNESSEMELRLCRKFNKKLK